jgi:hypothetical protein
VTPEGDDRVDLPGEATAYDGIRDDPRPGLCSDQIHLPLGELLHRGSQRHVGDRIARLRASFPRGQLDFILQSPTTSSTGRAVGRRVVIAVVA